MATRIPQQLNLNLLGDVIEEFIAAIGATLTGKSLIMIFGAGDEQDNWEAVYAFLSRLDGRTPASRESLLRVLNRRLKNHLYKMRLDHNAPKRVSQDPSVFSVMSPSECAATAIAMVFLVEFEIKRQKFRYVGQGDGMAILTHLATWDRKAAYDYCLSKLMAGEIRFYQSPSEVLPEWLNRYYQKTIVPWIQRASTC